MTTWKQTHEMIAVARKGSLEGLNAPAFELGKIQNDVGIVLFRLEGIGPNW